MLHRHPLLSLLTLAYLCFVGWLTLTPQPLDLDQQQTIVRLLDAIHRRGYLESIDLARLEFIANIGMFVPIGLFLLLLFGTRGWWAALGASVAMTVAIETAQRSIPGRVPDERDLLANSLGAVIGIAIGVVLTLPATLRRGRRRAARQAEAARAG